MGTKIVAKDVIAEGFSIEYSAAVSRGLEAIHFLNTSPQKAARNYAPGKPSGGVVGNPVAYSDRLACKGLTDYIQTALSESDSMTFFCIARSSEDNSSDAKRPGFFGNYSTSGLGVDGAAADGTVMYFRTVGNMAAAAGYGNTAADKTFPLATLSAADAAKWSLYVVQISTAGITFRDITNNRSSTQNGTGGLPRRRSLTKFQLGSNPSRFGGTCDVAVWQAHSVSLTEDEIATTIADLRGYALRKGIVV